MPAVVFLLAGRRRRLVDLLATRGGVGGAHVDAGSYILEAEVVGLGAVTEDADLVLGVAGVGGTLNTHTLVGVIAATGDGERLIHVATIGILLKVLPYSGAVVVEAVVIEPFFIEEEKPVLVEAVVPIKKEAVILKSLQALLEAVSSIVPIVLLSHSGVFRPFLNLTTDLLPLPHPA